MSYTDIVSDGGMDPRHRYEEERRTNMNPTEYSLTKIRDVALVLEQSQSVTYVTQLRAAAMLFQCLRMIAEKDAEIDYLRPVPYYWLDK